MFEALVLNMKARTKLLASLLLLVFLSFTGCTKTSAPVDQPANSPAAASEPQNAAGGATPAGSIKHFKGSIGSTLGLQMKLVREGDHLAGSYRYQKVGTPIDIRGTIDKDGNVSIDEFDASGKQTGNFQGLWTEGEDGLIAIAGNWAKRDTNKKTAFSLHEEPIEFSSGVEIVTRRIKESNKDLKYEIDAEYPQLTGSGSPNFEKFNQTVRGLITKKVSDFKQEMEPAPDDPPASELPGESMGNDLHIGYDTALAKDDLISIKFVVGSYYAGAAHPNSYSEVVNFDLKNGKLLKLADLFEPASKHLQTIAAYCIAELKRQGKQKGEEALPDHEWIDRGAGADAENYGSWTIGKKGLGITFDAYQVASYAQGPQYVLVPYTKLKDLIRSDGLIDQFR